MSHPDTTSSAHEKLFILDGLRGICALYVVLFHVRAVMTAGRPEKVLPVWLHWSTAWMEPGFYAVGLFIVLSGFCLMIPVARSADGRLRGGLAGYFRRRARRILPPYYFAVLASLAIIGLVPGMGVERNVWWDQSLPAFTPGVLWSHLFMVHNLSELWRLKINGVLWSIATEWQLYFVFPLVLLPIWRKYGLKALLGLAVLFVIGSLFIYGAGHSARPWYAGLFALGMAGAAVTLSERELEQTWRTRISWSKIQFICLGLVSAYWIFGLLTYSDKAWNQMRAIEVVLGCGMISLIINLLTHAKSDGSLMIRVLKSIYVRRLGASSYSLYLVHAPILGLLHLATVQLLLSEPATFGVMFFVGIPLTIFAAYLFFIMCESRFLSSHQRQLN